MCLIFIYKPGKLHSAELRPKICTVDLCEIPSLENGEAILCGVFSPPFPQVSNTF